MKLLIQNKILLTLLLSVGVSFADSIPEPILPDSILTPGDTLSVPLCSLCVRGYTKKVRNVPDSLKRRVFAEYKIKNTTPSHFEVDHLISLELGGSNNIKNLWPETYLASWNAHIKDKLENRLHALVCKKKVTLQQAQYEISHDWITTYKKYFPNDSTRK